MLLKVEPIAAFAGSFRIPSSKPETQRAILTGALAEGRSRVFNDLRCGETATMKAACRAMGVRIEERSDHLEIHGVGGAPHYQNRVIDAAGSGLVFRTLTALASVHPAPVIVTGNRVLCGRVMAPLFDALRQLGANVQSICGEGTAPIVNWGGLRGGRCELPGDVSSQFITAILFAAPFAETPVEIEVNGELYSRSYVQQTVTSLRQAGIRVDVSDDFRSYRVGPGSYTPGDCFVREDYTSASYLLAAAAILEGRTELRNMFGGSEQGEAALLGLLEQLGLEVSWDMPNQTLVIENHGRGLRGGFEFDARDCPNIVPTLAAIGAYVEGGLRVVGGKLTRFHKAPRVEAIVAELQRAGVDIEVLRDSSGHVDGFEAHGAATYAGNCSFSSWGDHRIFMSLFVASLKMRAPSYFSGFEDVELSFPGFLEEFRSAGVRMNVAQDSTAPAEAAELRRAAV